MKFYTISGTYGSGRTPTDVFCATDRKGLTWYVCEGSQNINATYDEVEEGVSVEELQDVDIITAGPINSLSELEAAIAD